MRLYYTSRPVLFCMCAGNELFYASLYLLNFTSGPFYIFNIGKFTYSVIPKNQVVKYFETEIDRNTFVQSFSHFSGNGMLPYRHSEISDCFVAGILGLHQSWQRRCGRKSPSCKKKRLENG